MTASKRFPLALAFTLFVLALTARAQTPSIEVSTDNERVEFAAQGETRTCSTLLRGMNCSTPSATRPGAAAARPSGGALNE